MTWARWPTMVNTCSRVSVSSTGRPSRRAAPAAMIESFQDRTRLPKPPPVQVQTTRTEAGGMPSRGPSSWVAMPGACDPVQTVTSVPPAFHRAVAACGSMATWCWIGWWNVPSTTTSLPARAASMEPTPGASRVRSGAAKPNSGGNTGVCPGLPAASEVRAAVAS